jgi:predicted secreted protein
MPWVIGVAAYIVIWWVVIFTMLPIGVRPVDEGDPGHAAGAPAHPYLLRKAAATSVIAAMLWLLLYEAVAHGLVNFRVTS